MIATLVHIWVKEEFREAFIEACRKNHEASVREPGNLRFDFLQDARDACKFVFYEVYESEDAVALHKQTAHYQAWRDTVADMMAQPREGVKHEVVFPAERELW